MKYIFVNLKRFDIPIALGGVCPLEDSPEWARGVARELAPAAKIAGGAGARLALFFPESLIAAAIEELRKHGLDKAVAVGSQGVFRQDVAKGGNFGAFTTNLPAKAAANLGCGWAIIGHSEERKDKFEIMAAYDPALPSDARASARASQAVSSLVNQELLRALEAGMHALLCVGETLEERGEGDFEQQRPRIEKVLKAQLETGLKGAAEFAKTREIVIGYEPRWAIGPGKTPPDGRYIEFVASYIKAAAAELYGLEPPVVYGGGLKEENAAMLAGLASLDGGLIALTRFSPPLGFSPEGLEAILKKYFGA